MLVGFDPDSGSRGLRLDLREALNRLLAERDRISRDAGLARPLDARHAPVEGGDQLLELTREIARRYRQGCPPLGRASRRETFQTSPHFPQRQ
jgi:hypothetical protein